MPRTAPARPASGLKTGRFVSVSLARPARRPVPFQDITIASVLLCVHFADNLHDRGQTRGDLEDYIVELNNDAPADLVAGDFNADLGQVREQLDEKGIPSNIFYPRIIPDNPVFKDLNVQIGEYPVAREAAATSMALPIFPEMTEQEQGWVIEGLKTVLS